MLDAEYGSSTIMTVLFETEVTCLTINDVLFVYAIMCVPGAYTLWKEVPVPTTVILPDVNEIVPATLDSNWNTLSPIRKGPR